MQEENMGVPSERIKLGEMAATELSRPRESGELPIRMMCQYGHHAKRNLIMITGSIRVPFYVCESCQVIYRYQELKLIPGDEGLPDE